MNAEKIAIFSDKKNRQLSPQLKTVWLIKKRGMRLCVT